MESGSVRSRPSCSQERGKRLTATIRFKARSQVIQDVALLLSASRDYCQHSFYESASIHTVGPTTDPPPDHRVPQRAFHNVVRRRDSFDVCEGLKTVLYLDELVACARRFHALAPRPFQKGLLDFPTQAVHPLLKRIPRLSPVAHPVPVTEQAPRQRKQPRSRSLALTTSVDHCLEVSV